MRIENCNSRKEQHPNPAVRDLENLLDERPQDIPPIGQTESIPWRRIERAGTELAVAAANSPGSSLSCAQPQPPGQAPPLFSSSSVEAWGASGPAPSSVAEPRSEPEQLPRPSRLMAMRRQLSGVGSATTRSRPWEQQLQPQMGWQPQAAQQPQQPQPQPGPGPGPGPGPQPQPQPQQQPQPQPQPQQQQQPQQNPAATAAEAWVRAGASCLPAAWEASGLVSCDPPRASRAAPPG